MPRILILAGALCAALFVQSARAATFCKAIPAQFGGGEYCVTLPDPVTPPAPPPPLTK